MSIIHIAGHLGTDPETRVTPTGQKVTTLRVATNIRRSGKDETIWYRVTIWGDKYDKMLPYLKKGSAVMIVGRLDKPEIYNDREGRPQVSLNVTADIVEFPPFGRPDGKQEGGSSPGYSQQGGQQQQGGYQQQGGHQQQGHQQQGYPAHNQATSGQGSYNPPSDADALPF